MMNYCKNHHLSTEGNKSHVHLCQASILKHQVINSMLDPNTLHCCSEWQGIDPFPESPSPMIVERPQDVNATNDQMDHINHILSIE